MSDDLTARQRGTAARREAFCRHYIVTLNAAEAARRAGYAAGRRARVARSEGRKKYDGAKVVGCRLRADPEIRERIAELARAAWADAVWKNHAEDFAAQRTDSAEPTHRPRLTLESQSKPRPRRSTP